MIGVNKNGFNIINKTIAHARMNDLPSATMLLSRVKAKTGFEERERMAKAIDVLETHLLKHGDDDSWVNVGRACEFTKTMLDKLTKLGYQVQKQEYTTGSHMDDSIATELMIEMRIAHSENPKPPKRARK